MGLKNGVNNNLNYAEVEEGIKNQAFGYVFRSADLNPHQGTTFSDSLSLKSAHWENFFSLMF
jgi:hypothetical protein